jgi:CheY-like chemotaxis protein
MLAEVPGVQTAEAANADEALELIVRGQPHLVVLDLHMPGRGGLDVIPEIKGLPVPPIVVVLTSHPTEHHERLCVAQGADFFFDKSRDFGRVVELARISNV